MDQKSFQIGSVRPHSIFEKSVQLTVARNTVVISLIRVMMDNFFTSIDVAMEHWTVPMDLTSISLGFMYFFVLTPFGAQFPKEELFPFFSVFLEFLNSVKRLRNIFCLS